MKRLFIASIAALSLHALLFKISPGWLGPKTLKNLSNKPLALTLSYVQPAKPEKKPVLSNPPVVQEKKRPVVKEKKIRKKTPDKKPKVQKKVEKPPQRISETKDIPDRNEDKRKLPPVDPEPTTQAPSPAAEETADFAAADLEAFSKEQGISAPIEEPVRATPGQAQEIPGPQPSRTVTIKDAMPLYKVNPRPDYPRIARRRGYEGTVVLSVFVTREGKVGKLEIAESSGYNLLDNSAIRAVKEWLFEPATKEGKNVDMWVRVPVTYRLR